MAAVSGLEGSIAATSAVVTGDHSLLGFCVGMLSSLQLPLVP